MSDPLHGKRKYRAFLFSLTALSILAAGDMLTPTFVEGLAWILGLFGLSNGVEHVSKAIQSRSSNPPPVARETTDLGPAT